MAVLELGIRTSIASLYDGRVRGVRAEDMGGWFGIRPGRRDLVAVLAPGFLLFEDDEGEAFVALAGGLLDLRGSRCRVMAREAVFARRLDEISDLVDEHLQRSRQRSGVQRDVFDALADEALRRLVRHERTP